MKIIGKKYLQLNNGIYFTDGIENGSIVDTLNKEIYRLDYEAKERTKELLSGYAIRENDSYIVEQLYNNNLMKVVDVVNNDVHPMEPMPTKIEIAWFELRKACNLKCRHCYNNSNIYAEDSTRIMSLDEWKKVVEQLSKYKPRTVVLIGGEPLMFKGICELIRHLHKWIPETNIVIYSNLTLLDKQLIVTLKEYNVKVVTSIYSDVPTIHDTVTQCKGSFNRTVNNVKLLMQNNISVKANTVIMSINEHTVDSTKLFLEELTGKKPKVDVIRVVRQELESLEPKIKKNNHTIRNINDLSKVTYSAFNKSKCGNTCWQGKINVSCYGEVTPCIMHQDVDTKYNLKDFSLDYVYEKHLKEKYWKCSKDRIEVCKDCEYRYACADCRPLAPQFLQRAENCTYNPYNGKWGTNIESIKKYNRAKKVGAINNASKVAFVFSCPGSLEEKSGCLCSGQTGKNLEKLLEILSYEIPEYFDVQSRDSYFITNASDCIHYKNYDGKSEPPVSEMLVPENLSRLYHELKDRKIIICCGKCAKRVLSELRFTDAKVVEVCHLGNRGLNSIHGVVGVEDKLKIVACFVKRQLY